MTTVRRRGAIALAMGASFALAGCNTTAEGPASAPIAAAPPSPVVGPAPAPQPVVAASPVGFGQPAASTGFRQPSPDFQRTTQTQTVNVSADGRTVRTETTRASVGFNSAAATTAVAGLALAAMTANRQAGPYMGAPGQYRLSTPNSPMSSCTVALYGEPNAPEGAAASSGCQFGSAFAGVTAWRLESGQLLIYRGSEVAIRMLQNGADRFTGTITWGPLSTSATLTRV